MTLTLFGRRVESCESTVLDVKVAEYPDGTPIGLRVRVTVGRGEGPRVSILGAQHGDEYGGMEIANRVMSGLDAGSLSGSVIAVPVSNPLAFNTAGRETPPEIGYENLNMNRVWPGDPKGLLMERIAAALWGEVILGSDLVLDLHEGGRAFMARYIHAKGTPETDWTGGYPLPGPRARGRRQALGRHDRDRRPRRQEYPHRLRDDPGGAGRAGLRAARLGRQ
jgi:hypothetical protein